MKNTSTAGFTWPELEKSTGVARPGFTQGERETIPLDSAICLEQFWIATDRISTAGLSPRLTTRYTLILELMFRLQMGLSGVLSLRGADVERNAGKLKGLNLPETGRFELVFHAPRKSYIPLVRSTIVNDILPIVGADIEEFASFALEAA
jgi:hypothetical protein